MYEIWLMLNIVWELVLLHRWALGAVLLGLALLWAAARGRSGRRTGPTFALVAAVVFPLAIVGLPMLFGSSVTEARYGPDWLLVIGSAAGAAMLAGLFAVPVARLLRTDRNAGARPHPPLSGGAAPRA